MLQGKKDQIIILVVVCLIGYAFFWYKFAWEPKSTLIDEQNKQYEALLAEKAQLDEDINKKPQKEAELKIKQNRIEHLKHYMMEQSDLSDGVDYIEKLSVMLGKNLDDIKVNPPKLALDESAQTPEGENPPQYYIASVEFKTSMTYPEVDDITRFVESGSKLVTISDFKISPKIAENSQGDTPKQETINGVPVFSVEMTMNFYSQDKGVMDRLYQYNKMKFKKATDPIIAPDEFSGKTRKLIDVGSSDNAPNSIYSDGSGTVRNTYGKGGFGINDNFMRMEFRSFLMSGFNFQLVNFKQNKGSILFRAKTRKVLDLNFYNSVFSASVNDEENKTRKTYGTLPEGDIFLMVFCDVPDIKENKDLFLDINIRNDSRRNLFIKYTDNIGRVKIKDRNGKEVSGKSEKEKISFS